MKPDILSYLEAHVARELVRYAASYNIHCPRCECVLDAKSTVILTDTANNTVCSCAQCYGRPVGNIKAGSVTVYDGRALWPSKSTKTWGYA